jgi:hypothetical protein
MTLKILARFQGRNMDDFRDLEPGKMPHELRFGELHGVRGARTRRITAAPAVTAL